MALRNCSAAHCSGADAELNEVCKQEGWAIGHPVITRDDQGPCQCHCSCLAVGTPVQATDATFRPIQDFQVNDPIRAAGKDLVWTELTVRFSNGTTGKSQQPYTLFIEYQGGSLIVTSDHLFLVAEGAEKKLVRADRLTVDDSLFGPDGGQVEILGVSMGTYYGGFHHVATSTSPPDPNLDGHLLNTNGVVSADYAAQIYYRVGELDKTHLVCDHDQRDLVGSPQYLKKHANRAKKAGKGAGHTHAASVAHSAHSPALKSFIDMSKARVDIPPDAVSFLSDQEAKRLEKFELRPLTDGDSQAWAQYLVQQYKYFYPAVEFEIDWYNDQVNAYAWVDASGTPHVALLGGLIRFPAMQIEGLALVAAHELGHIYGGAPYYPGTQLSCEGQADYFGARTIMRRVWFGETYTNYMIPAIQQLAKLFGMAGAMPHAGATTHAAEAGGCTHPPGPCRIDTYNAGVDLKPKPACAG